MDRAPRWIASRVEEAPSDAPVAVYLTGGACGSTDTANPDLPKCVTDDAGNSTAMRYDALGNLLSEADTTGGTTTGAKLEYTYQRAASATTGPDCGGKPGQRCTAKDPNGGVTSYEYDTDGNMTRITPPAPLGERVMEYDALGRLTAVTNGRGQRTTFSHDAQDRLLETVIPAAPGVAARTMVKSYDEDGNENWNNDAVISYDPQNRQNYVEVGGIGYSGWYDPAGNLLGMNGQDESYRYSYDDANQVTTAGLTGVTCTQDTTPQNGCVKFSYDNNGAEKQRWLPNASVMTTTRDASGRITRMTTKTGSTNLYDQGYSYQKAGVTGTAGDRVNIQSVTHHVGVTGAINHGSVTGYGYDSMDRLTSAVEKTAAGATHASWAYAYDKAGNRTGQTRVGSTQAEAGTLSYGYNAAHQLTSVNGDASHLGFDADGNETAAAGDDWVNVSQREATVSPIGDVTAMTTHNSAGDQSFEYGYAGVNPGQYLLTWAHGEQIGHSLLGIASQVDPGDVTQTILRGPNGKPLAVIRGSGAEQRVGYVIPDRLGSVIGLVGAGGGSNAVKIVSYACDPYGNIRSAPGLDEPLAWWNTLTWTGAPRDLQTGLYRLGVRWYDPVTGRFTTPDPTSQETNPYTYAGGNPCNTTDPTGGSGGRMGCNEWGFVIAMAGVGVGTKVPHPYVTTVSAIFAVGGYGFAVLCSAGTASTSGSESSATRSGRCFINSSTGARECPLMGDFFRQGGNGSLLYIGPLVAGLLLGRFIFARGPRWLMIVEASLAIFALLIALPYTGFLSILAPLGFMVGDLAGRNNYKKALMDHEKPSE